MLKWCRLRETVIADLCSWTIKKGQNLQSLKQYSLSLSTISPKNYHNPFVVDEWLLKENNFVAILYCKVCFRCWCEWVDPLQSEFKLNLRCLSSFPLTLAIFCAMFLEVFLLNLRSFNMHRNCNNQFWRFCSNSLPIRGRNSCLNVFWLL